jgi:hypothetical protein
MKPTPGMDHEQVHVPVAVEQFVRAGRERSDVDVGFLDRGEQQGDHAADMRR